MFENILGHENQIEILKSSILNNTISHSYLFSGPNGIGKLLIAQEFAKNILNVTNLNNCPDYKYINKRTDKKNILVEQIRKEISQDIYIAPASGNKKVYIIDDAEYLNDASQNALLKTLEEPPKYAVIILISGNGAKILPTVISRLYKITFNKLDSQIVNKYIIQNFNIELDNDIIKFADGSIGFASKIIKYNLIEELNNINKLYSYVISKDVIKCFKQAEDIDFKKEFMLDYFQYVFFSKEKYISAGIIEKAKERLRFNGNYDIVIDNMLLKCIEDI